MFSHLLRTSQRCILKRRVVPFQEVPITCVDTKWTRPAMRATLSGVSSSDPSRNRTCGLRFRKPSLYPAELWDRLILLTIDRSLLLCSPIAHQLAVYDGAFFRAEDYGILGTDPTQPIPLSVAGKPVGE